MCDQLGDLRRALTALSVGFDARVISVADAAAVVAHATAIEAAAGALKARAAARASEGNEWKAQGFRSPADALARQTGISAGAARQTLETGRHLEANPELARAAGSGRLSPAQATLIAGALQEGSQEAGRLIDHAQRSSFADLRDEVARAKVRAGLDLENRRRTIHAHRRLRSWTDPEGAWHLHAVGNPEDGALIDAALSPIANQVFHQARQAGRREPPPAYAFDALVSLATREPTDRPAHPASSSEAQGAEPPDPSRLIPTDHDPDAPPSAGPRGTPTPRLRGTPIKILVRIDYDSFLRGVSLPGETCEIVGYGPVPVSAVEDLIQRGDPFVAAILTRGEALVGVAHLGRQPTATQRSALQWLYPSCAAEGCAVQARLQYDHRIDWAKTHYTMLDQLDALCAHHHALKTRSNWALVPGHGKRPFVPPDDPRHPSRGIGSPTPAPPTPANHPDRPRQTGVRTTSRPRSTLRSPARAGPPATPRTATIVTGGGRAAGPMVSAAARAVRTPYDDQRDPHRLIRKTNHD